MFKFHSSKEPKNNIELIVDFFCTNPHTPPYPHPQHSDTSTTVPLLGGWKGKRWKKWVGEGEFG